MTECLIADGSTRLLQEIERRIAELSASLEREQDPAGREEIQQELLAARAELKTWQKRADRSLF